MPTPAQEHGGSMRCKGLEGGRAITIWLAAGAYLAIVVGFAWNPTALGQGIAAIGIAASLAHASLSDGFRHALVLFIMCNAVTFGMENLGVATGFPFGHYHFEVAQSILHIGAIPAVVGPLWFGMGYFSWAVAGILLGGNDCRVRERFNVFLLPLVAAFVMTQRTTVA
jgi:putative membrane protein